MTSVALHVLNGPNAGQRLWVRLEQILHVGSTDQADVMIAAEPGGKPFCFSIAHSRAGCFAESLNDQSPMNINGKEMQRARLHDGDILMVGAIQFRALVE
jgi:hypothetical protein